MNKEKNPETMGKIPWKELNIIDFNVNNNYQVHNQKHISTKIFEH